MDEPVDRTSEPTCGRCAVVRDAVILPGLLVCHGCDCMVIQQATVSVPGKVQREPCPCQTCIKAR